MALNASATIPVNVSASHRVPSLVVSKKKTDDENVTLVGKNARNTSREDDHLSSHLQKHKAFVGRLKQY